MSKHDALHKAFDSARTQANDEIMRRIIVASHHHPTLRFHQLLEFLGVTVKVTVPTVGMTGHPTTETHIKNDFYTEPQEVLKRMNELNRG